MKSVVAVCGAACLLGIAAAGCGNHRPDVATVKQRLEADIKEFVLTYGECAIDECHVGVSCNSQDGAHRFQCFEYDEVKPHLSGLSDCYYDYHYGVS